MVFGAILAGGVGSRMNRADMPKQFLPLKDKPIIIHTLEGFLRCKKIDGLLVGVHGSWMEHMHELIAQYLPEAVGRIAVVCGGNDRNETIQNLICAIEERYGQSDDHIILTHDAVRPFLDQRILEENIAGTLLYGAVDTVVPATDTIVVSADGKTVTDIPNRAQLYQGQTPQSFRIPLLKKMYALLTEEEKQILTDASKICVLKGHPVHLVMGSYSNMKITTPDDYNIAQALAERFFD